MNKEHMFRPKKKPMTYDGAMRILGDGADDPVDANPAKVEEASRLTWDAAVAGIDELIHLMEDEQQEQP